MVALLLITARQAMSSDEHQNATTSFWPWQTEERKPNTKEMRKQHKIVVLLERGDLAFSKDRLNAPQHDNALLYYYTALKVDPDSKQARRGLSKVAERFRSLARTAHNNGNGKQTRTYLRQAEMITGASDPANIKLRRELRETASGQNSRELGRELQKRLNAKKESLKDNPLLKNKDLLKDKDLLDDALSIPVTDEE